MMLTFPLFLIACAYAAIAAFTTAVIAALNGKTRWFELFLGMLWPLFLFVLIVAWITIRVIEPLKFWLQKKFPSKE